MMKKSDDISIKVGELTNRAESGRGIVRIDSKNMSNLGLREGDIIELSGQKKTGAIAVRAYPSDVGLNIARMDGITRMNIGVGVGETVKIKKAEVKEAKKVTLAPAQKGITLMMNPDLLKKNLFMRPVFKGDIISPFPVVKRKTESPFEDFFRSFGIDVEGLGDFSFTPIPGETKLAVVSTQPEGIVKITDMTQVELRKEAMEVEMGRIPTITYEDIGGLHESIQKIREMVELPLRHPELFTKLGISPPKGVLLYGPPGTGKTLLAKAVANESGANFISIRGPEILSKWVGESEKRIREVFKRAKQVAPSIIFFDEMDAIVPRRGLQMGTRVMENVVSQILTQMSGMEELHNVVVIGATNRPDILDPALLRPGRFDRQVFVPAPDEKSRLEIFKIHTKNMPLKGVDLKKLAKQTEGYSGADIESLCREAGLNALRENINAKEVVKKHFNGAMEKVKPSINVELIKFYDKMSENFKTRGTERKRALKEETDYLG